MAEKISTVVLKVDLDCHLCYKKIRKILCKLQEKENIKTISYDDKNKTVTISGPFDARKISGKLTCKAGKVIKEVQIKENKDKEKEEKPKDTKPAEKEKPKDTKAAEKEKPKDTKPAEKEKPKPEKETKPAAKAKADAEPAKAKPKADAEPAKAKPKADGEPAKAKPDQPKAEPAIVVHSPMGWPAGPVCCCRPSYEAYYGGGRCCSCGMVYGCMGGVQQGFYGGAPQGYNRNCQYFCEEDPTTCSIM